MPPLLTPPADWNHVAEALQKLAAIDGLIADAEAVADPKDPPPGLASAYLETAADLAKQVAMALQAASGAEQRRCEAAARERGLECCRGGCGHWLPKEQLIRRSTGWKEERSNTYWSCVECGGPDENGIEEERR